MIRWLSRIVLLSLALRLFGMAPRARAAEPKLIDLKAGDRLVARYMADPNPLKPYIKELFTPSGVQVMLDSPPDHVHHHGLMFAIGANEIDFWSEKPPEKFGRQIPIKTEEIYPHSSQGKPRGNASAISQGLSWTAPDGKALLTETRQITVDFEHSANILSWKSILVPVASPPVKPVKLWGRHYFGLGLRLIPDLNGKVNFVYPPGTPPGQVVRGDERLTTATWCAATGEVGGKPVTVAMWSEEPWFSARWAAEGGDPRFPTAWFTMSVPFAYFGATLNLEHRTIYLTPDERLNLHYGVALFDGIIDAGTIEKEYQAWCLKYKR